MLLLDNSGVVKRVWYGKLDADQQAQVLKAILAG